MKFVNVREFSSTATKLLRDDVKKGNKDLLEIPIRELQSFGLMRFSLQTSKALSDFKPEPASPISVPSF